MNIRQLQIFRDLRLNFIILLNFLGKEVTGQPFEDMKEQNDRIVQKLSGKDEASFKLISDRINANQKKIILSEEIQALEQQVYLA